MSKKLFLCIILIAIAAVYFRSAGLFRGMDKQYEFHPDVGKQIIALRNFLNDEYHWKADNPFVKGYPYALNHLDEVVFRTVAGATAMTDQQRHHFFNNWWVLHHTVKVLRVMYGMICFLLLYKISTFLFSKKASMVAALLLFACMPVSIDVAHFATGDIGVDLFSCLMLLFLLIYARTEKPGWLFLSTFFVGVAFACKYNGIFTGIAVALYFVLLTYFKGSVRSAVTGLLLIVSGFVSGVLAATPAFFIIGEQHLDDILASMKFIQQYGVPPEVLEQSFVERLWNGFSSNVPRLGRGFGVFILGVGTAGVCIAGGRMYQVFAERRQGVNLDTSAVRLQCMRFAVFLYPCLALAASLIVKHAVMPFHFSYLAVPFVLAAVYVLDQLWGAEKWIWKLLGCIILILLSVELGRKTMQNNFFWQRMDNSYVHFAMPRLLENTKISGAKRGRRESLKSVVLEPESSAFFRNRYSDVSIYGASRWKQSGFAPVPSIPYPDGSEWIFLNGPILPMNDRMFHVKGGWNGKTEEKQLVLYHQPQKMFLGLRSGAFPIDVELAMGGTEKRVRLGEWEQAIVEIEPAHWKRVDGRDLDHDIYFVPLRVTIPHHEVWVSVISDERERDQFALFGGQLDEFKEGLLPDVPDAQLVNMVNGLNYYSSDKGGIVHASGKSSSVALSLDNIGLPAGAYVLSGRIEVLSDEAEVSVQFRDLQSKEPVGKKVVRSVKQGARAIHVPLVKQYDPFGCEIVVTAVKGGVNITSWTIRPHTKKIIRDLKAWQRKDVKPPWLTEKS